MDTATITKLAFGLVGGLGIFLLGMKNMSEGMQSIAGSRLRRMISAVTDNRLMATGTGTLVTCMVQSSSITTVMVVGFVNSGVMQLSQGIGVIMGANVGTTITGWILVLKIGKYGLPILGLAAFVYLFVRQETIRNWALAVLGIGMIFFGLELMKNACGMIEELPQFKSWFELFQADNYFGVLGCALAGCVLTMAVQSSSATLGITISLAVSGVISYPTAAALILGENLGTTVTAFLASLGTTTNARRAAYFHVAFNLIGVLWITAIFHWYIDLIQYISPGDVNLSEAVNGDETKLIYPHRTAAIAATHTVFNVANTLLFLPLLPLMVRLMMWLVPSREFKEKPHLTDLNIRMLESPLMAIEQSRKELEKMDDGCQKMMDWFSTLLQQDERDQRLSERLQRREGVLDAMHDEIASFITDLLSANVPHSVAEEARRQLRMADEYESVSDYIANLDKFDRKLRKSEQRFTPEQCEALAELHRQSTDYLVEIGQALAQENRDVLTKIDATGRRIRLTIKDMRRQHLDDLSSGKISPQVSVAFLATLNAYARVRDHSHNIAEAISGEK
ncbi:MAG: Na/Pi cotransporter family protein [Pirellulales bacterium]|nr:Na/Pi cotransporter family protein [Pirellulales bacterium]